MRQSPSSRPAWPACWRCALVPLLLACCCGAAQASSLEGLLELPLERLLELVVTPPPGMAKPKRPTPGTRRRDSGARHAR